MQPDPGRVTPQNHQKFHLATLHHFLAEKSSSTPALCCCRQRQRRWGEPPSALAQGARGRGEEAQRRLHAWLAALEPWPSHATKLPRGPLGNIRPLSGRWASRPRALPQSPKAEELTKQAPLALEQDVRGRAEEARRSLRARLNAPGPWPSHSTQSSNVPLGHARPLSGREELVDPANCSSRRRQRR